MIETHQPNCKNTKYGTDRMATLRGHSYSRIGQKRVDRITSTDVMAFLRPIWHGMHGMPRRVRKRIGIVMEWAVPQGYQPGRPAVEAIGAAPPKCGVQRHRRKLSYEEVVGPIRAVRQYDVAVAAKLAFEFSVPRGCWLGDNNWT